MGDASRALNNAHEISKLLDCGLDKEALSICVALIEAGVNPEASDTAVLGWRCAGR
jgi:mitotic-spindle organizing protein 1